MKTHHDQFSELCVNCYKVIGPRWNEEIEERIKSMTGILRWFGIPTDTLRFGYHIRSFCNWNRYIVESTFLKADKLMKL